MKGSVFKSNIFDNKKVVIFDIDGTLLDTIGMWNDIDAIVIERIGGQKHENIGYERDQFLAQNTSGDIFFNYSAYLKNRYNSKMSVSEIHGLRSETFPYFLINKVDFKPQAEIFIQLLKELNYKLVLASLTTRETIELYTTQNKNICSKCSIRDSFDLILLKEDVKEKKPNPEIYLKVLLKLGVKPEECIIIEDSLSGIQAAKRAGIQVINIYDKYSDCDREEINNLTDYSVDGYQDLIIELQKKHEIATRKLC